MSKIKMDGIFGESNFISRIATSNLPYNSIIERPEHSKIVISENNRMRELHNIDSPNINPHKESFWRKGSLDPNQYVFYFINTAKIEGFLGNHVDTKNRSTDPFEKFFFRINYNFNVNHPINLITNFISELQLKYDTEYFKKKINRILLNIAQNSISNLISDKGIEYFQNHVLDITKQIQNDIDNSTLSDSGLEIQIEQIEVDEGKFREIREHKETSEYISKNMRED